MFNKPKASTDKTVVDTQKTTTSKITGGIPPTKPTGEIQTIPPPASIAGAPAPKPTGGVGWISPYKGYRYRYKGQIHCHSCEPFTNKDGTVTFTAAVVGTLIGAPVSIAGLLFGDATASASQSVYEWAGGGFNIDPTVVARCYKNKGYKFLCLTDHHIIRRGSNERGILHIYSVEDGMSSQHHIEVLGINFDAAKTNEATYFDGNHDGVCDWRSYSCDNLPGRIYYYSNIQNAITVLGHPRQPHGGSNIPWGNQQGYSLDDLRRNAQASYRGKDYSYTGMEIYNAGSNQFDDNWWDQLLEEGKRVWGFAGDDCHSYYTQTQTSPDIKQTSQVNKRNFNRGWITVFSNKDVNTLKQEDARADILQNIRDGNFCAVVRSPDVTGDTPGDGNEYEGPWFNLSVSGNMITVTTDPDCTHIMSVRGPGRVDKHKLIPQPDGKKAVTFELSPESKYARFVLEASFKGEQYRVFSQPLFNVSAVKTR